MTEKCEEQVVLTKMIPQWPYSDEKEEEAVVKVLRSGIWWRNAGTEVKQFEKEFARYQDSTGAVSVANGTLAIEIALKALHIGAGDEVIVPAFTFYSTVSAVLSVGAIPVIVDVLADTFCIAPDAIKNAITSKTKAIIPVHMAGNAANMDEINQIAKDANLYVIEDSAHGHGGAYKGKKLGSLSTCGTFSFQNAKLLTAGEGGIIISDHEEFLKNAFFESNCGRAENDTTYQHILVGTNARLSEIQGAILRVQLKRFDQQIELREKNYQYLKSQLEKIKGITLQVTNKDTTRHPHYMVMFYFDEEQFHNASRDEFVKYLKSFGIPCNRSFESIHKLPVFQTMSKDRYRVSKVAGLDEKILCPNSERISDHVVCLNHNILLGEKELLDAIVDIIKKF